VFKAFAPAVLAGIGEMAPTLRDRSIRILLTKAPPGGLKVLFDKRKVETENTLGSQMLRWARDNVAAIGAFDPVMPPVAHNRLADNWRPLFAIAQTIGGHWPQLAVEAFHAVGASAGQPQGSSGEPSEVEGSPFNLQLLEDVRLIFQRSGAQRLFSSALVEGLRGLPDRPWCGRNGEKPIDAAKLAGYLIVFGIAPQQIRIGGRRCRGYELADLVPAFERLLSDRPS
jgi:hypothetical protein